jgi:FkbM family methyltransferase
MDGAFEINYLDFIASCVDGKVFFDVGANIGSYSLSLHKKAKKIYAFEASMTNTDCLNENIRTNNINNIETINQAVSDEDNKTVKIYLSPNATGHHSLYDKSGGKYEYVQTITLDSFCEKNNIKEIGIIKIDVEGAEFDVIKGANQVLEKFQPLLIVEFCAATASLAGHELADLYFRLKNLGYASFLLKNHMLCEINVDAIKGDNDFFENIIFVNTNNSSVIPNSYFQNSHFL